MNNRPPPSLTECIAAAQDWWRDAGVDQTYAGEPQRWIADEETDKGPSSFAFTQEPPEPEPATSLLGGDPENWPKDLPSFREWWLAEPSLDQGGTYPRVASRGGKGARLMMIVPMPEAGDTDVLLSGPQGRLLASFAQAADIDLEEIHFAAALPRHSPVPDWNGLQSQGLGQIIRHMVELADPARVIVMGTGILPLVGHDPAQGAPSIGQFAIQGRTLPLLASYAPGRLLDHPRLRSSFWKRWLEWTDGDAL